MQFHILATWRTKWAAKILNNIIITNSHACCVKQLLCSCVHRAAPPHRHLAHLLGSQGLQHIHHCVVQSCFSVGVCALCSSSSPSCGPPDGQPRDTPPSPSGLRPLLRPKPGMATFRWVFPSIPSIYRDV
eukprot:403275-Pelagomonas_calceolata.AAC.1